MKKNSTLLSLSIIIGLALGSYLPTSKLTYTFLIFYGRFVNKKLIKS